MELISFEDFAKIEIRIGQIREVSVVENSEKLLRLQIDFGDFSRQILAGIRPYFSDPQVLIGKQLPVIVNLAPRKMAGETSEGMIVATDNADGIVFLVPDHEVQNGACIR